MDGQNRELLERMAKAQEQIVALMGKPESKALQIFQYGTGIVTILGIVAIIDIIIRWIMGG